MAKKERKGERFFFFRISFNIRINFVVQQIAFNFQNEMKINQISSSSFLYSSLERLVFQSMMVGILWPPDRFVQEKNLFGVRKEVISRYWVPTMHYAQWNVSVFHEHKDDTKELMRQKEFPFFKRRITSLFLGLQAQHEEPSLGIPLSRWATPGCWRGQLCWYQS